jgi:adenosylhomocysteine nucleosidase
MTDVTFDDPCILFPLRRESSAFRTEFRPQQRFPDAPCWARFCGPSWLTVLVLETGLGVGRTEAVLRWLLSKPRLENVPYQPKVVLSAGFCGALQPDLQVGDIILANELADLDGNRWPTTWPGGLSGEWRPPLHRGRLLTVSQLASGSEEKRRLGKQYQAMGVDMESAVVARLCSQQGVPFGCVRAVSDTVQTALSARLVSLLTDGRISWLRLAGNVAASPRLLGEMMRLARDTRLAARQLGAALGELLTLTLPGGATL